MPGALPSLTGWPVAIGLGAALGAALQRLLAHDRPLSLSAEAVVPYKCDDVFAVRAGLQPTWLYGADGTKALVVDDFYERPDEIRALLRTATWWKDAPGTRNGIDYLDCRTQLGCSLEATAGRAQAVFGALAALATEHFGHGARIEQARGAYGVWEVLEFNLFRFLRPAAARGREAFPHRDGGGSAQVAALVYLNTEDEAAGGTRLYREQSAAQQAAMAADYSHLAGRRVDPEALDALVAVDRYYDVALEVPMRYNRAVLYSGRHRHGAWFDANASASEGGPFHEHWRVTQIFFMRPQPGPEQRGGG